MWRTMPIGSEESQFLSQLANRFNAWQRVTSGKVVSW